LTQNRKFACGNIGDKRYGRYLVLGTRGAERPGKRHSAPSSAAHNPKVVGSNPASATIYPPFSHENGGFSLLFELFEVVHFSEPCFDPNLDPYGESSRKIFHGWRVPERI